MAGRKTRILRRFTPNLQRARIKEMDYKIGQEVTVVRYPYPELVQVGDVGMVTRCDKTRSTNPGIYPVLAQMKDTGKIRGFEYSELEKSEPTA